MGTNRIVDFVAGHHSELLAYLVTLRGKELMAGSAWLRDWALTHEFKMHVSIVVGYDANGGVVPR